MTMLYENFRLALFSLKANKMRALLTMLGIIIGISSVIAIMTIGDGLSSALAGSMSDLGANNVEVGIQYREFEDGEGPSRRVTVEDLMTLDMVEQYYEMYADEIKAIQILEYGPSGRIVDGNLYANIDIRGQNTPGFAIDTVKLEYGRFFTKAEMDDKRKVCIISQNAVDNLYKGNAEKALGQTISVETEEKNYLLTVVGVYTKDEDLGAFGMGTMTTSKDKSTALYVPLLTAMEMEHSDERITGFTVLTGEDVDQNVFSGKTKRFMNRFYETNDLICVESFAMASMVETVTGIMSKITIGISVIAGIALLVGGIGVMNIMLVSITERTREIGTRKALGAPNSSIRMQFIIESVVICIIGGIIGIILGCSIGMIAIKLIGAGAMAPSIRAIVISLGFSTAIGVFFGYYPANKAAKMDPIEALRYE